MSVRIWLWPFAEFCLNRSQEKAAEIDGWVPTVDDKIEICGCGKEMISVNDCFDFSCFECGHDDWIWNLPGDREVLSEKYIVGVV